MNFRKKIYLCSIRGIKEYQNNHEKGYLIDTCLNSQDNYEKIAKYFLEDN